MRTPKRRSVIALALGTTMMLLPAIASFARGRTRQPKHVLVVTVTLGFRHDSIPTAEQTIKQLGDSTGLWTTDFVRTPAEMQTMMTDEALKKYDAVIFANTTGVLPLPDPNGFLAYIHSGHGFVAMHAGSDTFHQWPGQSSGVSMYAQMLGGEFRIHHNQCAVKLEYGDRRFPAVAPLLKAATPHSATAIQLVEHGGPSVVTSNSWTVFDEIYLFKNFDPAKVHLLLYSPIHPNDGTPNAGKPGLYPISWCKMYGRGRVFYTALGHRKRTWNDPLYQQHILGGIEWALGLVRGDARPGNVSIKSLTKNKESVNK